MAKGNPNGTCGEQKGPSEEEEEKKKRDEETPVLLSTRTPQLTDDDVPPFDEPFCLCKYGAETDDMGDKTLTQDACTHVPDSQYFVYENSAGDLQGGVRSLFFSVFLPFLIIRRNPPSPRTTTERKKKEKLANPKSTRVVFQLQLRERFPRYQRHSSIFPEPLHDGIRQSVSVFLRVLGRRRNDRRWASRRARKPFLSRRHPS